MTRSKVVVVMMSFMVTAEMTQSLLEKEMTRFGVVVVMTSLMEVMDLIIFTAVMEMIL